MNRFEKLKRSWLTQSLTESTASGITSSDLNTIYQVMADVKHIPARSDIYVTMEDFDKLVTGFAKEETFLTGHVNYGGFNIVVDERVPQGEFIMCAPEYWRRVMDIFDRLRADPYTHGMENGALFKVAAAMVDNEDIDQSKTKI